jgi:hypothetical protein
MDGCVTSEIAMSKIGLDNGSAQALAVPGAF